MRSYKAMWPGLASLIFVVLIALLPSRVGAQTVDIGFNPNANSTVYAIAVQADGKIVVGGLFDRIGGQARSNIARLNADGSLDAGFNPNATDWVEAIAVQTDGKIVVGGVFTQIDGQARSNIARLEADGSAETSIANPNNFVYATALQGDGKLLIAGEFTQVDGVPQHRLARLFSGGRRDPQFNVGANNAAWNILLQADNKIVVTGGFTGVFAPGAQPRNGIARFNADGSLDAAFDPGVAGTFALAQQADGKLVLGGRVS